MESLGVSYGEITKFSSQGRCCTQTLSTQLLVQFQDSVSLNLTPLLVITLPLIGLYNLYALNLELYAVKMYFLDLYLVFFMITRDQSTSYTTKNA